jgi:glutamate-1-semialdehyde aminotransferase
MFLLGEKLAGIVREAVEELGLNAVVQGVGPMFQIFFTDKEAVWSLRDLGKCLEGIIHQAAPRTA